MLVSNLHKLQEAVNIQISNTNSILVLCVNSVPERRNKMFSQAATDSLYDYKVIELNGDYVDVIEIKNQSYNFHFVQEIDADKILLVGSRCIYYDSENQDKNAKIFDRDGKLINEFVLGDGIQDLYVSKNEVIWSSYFDEGVFGNYGWNNPIGANGLVSWDKSGNKIYEYCQGGDYFIDDCYALNLRDNGEVWFYYYTDFQVAKLDTSNNLSFFDPSLSGSDGFILNDKYMLFRGGYDENHKYSLYKHSKNYSLELIDEFNLIINESQVLENYMFSCRDSKMVHCINNHIYIYDLNSDL